mmetsp:Transcript_43567/g.92698  ORF Transcript_43567/g.92698 Transcript_43567/m.92698 type:complete len:208 (-) Transcript_43567:28-651(-)
MRSAVEKTRLMPLRCWRSDENFPQTDRNQCAYCCSDQCNENVDSQGERNKPDHHEKKRGYGNQRFVLAPQMKIYRTTPQRDDKPQRSEHHIGILGEERESCHRPQNSDTGQQPAWQGALDNQSRAFGSSARIRDVQNGVDAAGPCQHHTHCPFECRSRRVEARVDAHDSPTRIRSSYSLHWGLEVSDIAVIATNAMRLNLELQSRFV